MRNPLENNETKVEVLRLINEGVSFRKISERMGISKSSLNDFILKKTYKDWWDTNSKPIAAGDVYDHHDGIRQLDKTRYIITSCQNNTFVHTQFLESLETMAKHIDAQIIVGTFSYNKTGFQNLEKSEGEWFDPKIEEYILDEPAYLADGLLWCGELNILPTAVNPLSGLHSYTKSSSGIVPHAKVQLESLATHKSEPCRMLYTTGAVSKRNYIQKKSGQKASFHHVFGALIVEVDDDGDWFVRQLIADSDTGCFHDLDTLYTPEYPVKNAPVEAINWGDIHVEKLDETVADASFYGDGNMLDTLKPRHQFIHDVLDHEARNHHNINDPYFRFKVYKEGRDHVEDNIRKVVKFLESIRRQNCNVVVVESNHDLALKKWLKEADYKNDPANAIFFLECQLKMYRAIENDTPNHSILGEVVNDMMMDDYAQNTVDGFVPFQSHCTFLTQDESYKICGQSGHGIECGSHGHLGSNGSKGGVSVYQKLGSRYNIGHSHSAAIKDGVYVAGVSGKLDMGYNSGACSWSHSHIVTYPNGKRTIITLRNGKWKA